MKKTHTLPPSRWWFRVVLIGFGTVFLGLALNHLVLDDVVVAARRGANGPEVLFRGVIGLWAPTPWAQYFWYQLKPLILLPFGMLAVAVAYWHSWEEKKAGEDK